MSWTIRYKDATGRELTLADIRAEDVVRQHAKLLTDHEGGCQIVEIRNAKGFVIKGDNIPEDWKGPPKAA